MASAALFVGWGAPVRGREKQSFDVFNEAIQFFSRQVQEGNVESFEPVQLESHGGDLSGFMLIKGDRAKLERMRYSPDFRRLVARAETIVDNFGIVAAFIGEEMQREFAVYQEVTQELAGH
jgi:hypothetical protein